MQELETIQKLIDDATERVGSKSKLARAMGVDPQTMNSWYSGFRSCVPEDRARLAAFAQQDALQELVRATLEKTAGTLRGEQLRQVLGKWLHQTGGASVGVLAGLASTIFLALAMLTPGPANADPIFHDVYYVKRDSAKDYLSEQVVGTAQTQASKHNVMSSIPEPHSRTTKQSSKKD